MRDIQDFDYFQSALAQGEEQLFPIEVVDKLLEDQNPIKVFREYRGMTQDELANKIDISIPYLSQLETNKRRGSIKGLTNLAKELGITLDMILGDTD